MNTSPRRALSTAFLLLLAAALTSFPQDLDHATLSGTVTDTNRAPVVGARVSLVAVEAGTDRSQTTESDGRFKFVSIAPGDYFLTASMEGFEKRASGRFVLASAADLRIELTLHPKTVLAEQTVTAEGGSEIFTEGARAAVGGTIDQQSLSELPNVRSDLLDFALLLGGAYEEALSTRDLSEDVGSNPRSTPFEQGLISLAGGTAYSNNITIDGLDNNDDRTSRERFSPPIEAVSEVQIMRNQFSAEYGRASGGRINVVTRSGGRKMHGVFGLRVRDERLNANTWQNRVRGIERPMLRERRASAFISGPLCGRRCPGDPRVAASYELLRTGDTTLVDTFVPTDMNPRFPLPQPNGTEVFCDSRDTADCSGPLPRAGLMSQFTSLLTTPNVSHGFTLRVDAKPRRNLELNASFQLGNKKLGRNGSPSVSRLPETIQARSGSNRALSLSALSFGQRSSNHTRVQWSEYSPRFSSEDPMQPVVIIAFRNPLTGSSSSLVAGNSTASTLQNFSESRKERRLQFMDSLTIVRGRHTVKSGVDIHSIDSRADSTADSTGTFNFPSMFAFTNNTLSRYRQNFGTRSDVKNIYGGSFLNDEIRASETLNLTFGMRFEAEGAVRDRNNFGPRLGAAWDPIGDGAGVVRFGAGIFYNRVLLRTIGDFARGDSSLAIFDTNLIGTSASDLRRTAILSAISGRFPSGFSSLAELRSLLESVDCGSARCATSIGFSSTGSSSLPLRKIDERIEIPESRQMNIGYERRVASGISLEIDFTFNKTKRLWREYDSNAPILPSGYQDWTAFLIGNPFLFRNSNGNLRTYQFFLGLPTDPSVSTRPGSSGSCSTTANVTCYVNLNSISGSTSAPSTATSDSSNSIGAPIGIALAAIDRFRPNTGVGRQDTIASIGRASYRAVIFGIRSRERRFGFGLRGQFRASYTLSSQRDDGLNNTGNAEVNGDFNREFSRGLQDRRHRIALFGMLTAPRLFGRVTFAPVMRYGSSAPFNIGTGVDRNLDGSETDRPVFLGSATEIRWRRPGSTFPSELYELFSLPAIGSRGGSLSRNAGTGPALFILDLSVSRTLKLREKVSMKPSLELGNLLNATVFSYGSEYIDFSPIGPVPTPSQIAARDRFLVPSRTLRPREARVGMRIEF